MKQKYFLFCSFFLYFLIHSKDATLITQKLFDILLTGSTIGYIGEPISQCDHALQAAYQASCRTNDNDVIVAALFHDIGNLCATDTCQTMASYGIKNHEEIGAQYLLNLGFSKKIAELIRGHVQAKRYLVYKQNLYHTTLSKASQCTLLYQGGPMAEHELYLFEQDPLFKLKLLMRICDEQAKDPYVHVPNLEHYRPLVEQHISRTLDNKK